MEKLSRNNFFLLIILGAVWGSSFLAIKIAVQTINPISIAALRLTLAAILVYIYFSYRKLRFPGTVSVWIILFLVAFIGNVIPFFLISWAEQSVSSNMAGLLMSVGPIFTLALAHFFTDDDKFTRRKLLGTVVGFFGVIILFGFSDLLMIFKGNLQSSLPKLTIVGAALCYVTSGILAYRLKKINTIAVTTGVAILAALISLPLSVIYELQNYSAPSAASLSAVVYLGIFSTAFAFLIRFYLLSKAGPTFLSYVAYLIPVFAVLWGYLFLRETISLNMFIALILILTGTYIGKNIPAGRNSIHTRNITAADTESHYGK